MTMANEISIPSINMIKYRREREDGRWEVGGESEGVWGVGSVL